MRKSKPTNIESYIKWLKDEQDVVIDNRTENHYSAAIVKARQDIQQSPFWQSVSAEVQNWEAEYRLKTGYPLFVRPFEEFLLIKSYDSFLLKTFRKNILENKNWPNEPQSGWLKPDNWLTLVNDAIRTLFVVKYLDGVLFLRDKLEAQCTAGEIKHNVYFEAREEGYYAVHMYTSHEVEIPLVNWNTETLSIRLEIQISTQLQEVIRQLLHKHYEKVRVVSTKDKKNWQWNYQSEEFAANYLGHILHYVEGMIMDIRDKQKEAI